MSWELNRVYETLLAHYGPQSWWPAETPTEVVVGAILTQNTAWRNVERAISELRSAKILTWNSLHAVDEDRLAELIRASGTYRVKARRLKAFVDHLFAKHGGSLESLLGGDDLNRTRRELLTIAGIGPETADAILLYAGGRPSFVVDAYTMRILRRHYVVGPSARYEEVRALFLASLSLNTQMFNEFHALLVQVGKLHCRARAVCHGCPLDDWDHDATL